jgi:hypothetical protein
MKTSRKHWCLLAIPYIWDVLLIPQVNQVTLRPLGVPFLLLWMMAGIIVTSVCIGIVFSLDRKLERTLQTAQSNRVLNGK